MNWRYFQIRKRLGGIQEDNSVVAIKKGLSSTFCVEFYRHDHAGKTKRTISQQNLLLCEAHQFIFTGRNESPTRTW